jgi:hypothetical protein
MVMIAFVGGSHVLQIVLISLQGRSSVCEWHVEATLEIEFSADGHTEGSEEQHSMEGDLKPRPRDRTCGV